MTYSPHILRHVIDGTRSLRDALGMLNTLSGDVMTLIVVDGADRVIGTLTDGDVRRALLGGLGLDSRVDEAMHRQFHSLSAGALDLDALRAMRSRGISLIPVLDPDGRIADLIDTRRTHTILPLSAILMAGGRGERLRPLTLEIPKPLLPVGNRAIIDYNVAALAAVGVKDITVTTNYLAHKIEEHFARPVEGVHVKCVRENRYLGTLGAASLVHHPAGGNTLVMNSDLLTTISLEDMYLAHRRENADITIAAVPYNVQVPYAILTTDGRRVSAIEEKPSYSYYANAGIYIFANRLLDTLTPDIPEDAPSFVEKAIDSGARVAYFPIDGMWIDIGSPTDYAHACELMRSPLK